MNGATNSKVLAQLLSHSSFKRFAGFANSKDQGSNHPPRANFCQIGCFATWSPRLYQYYASYINAFHHHHPELAKNFPKSVFAATTFNLGPQTVSVDHTDHCNLPFGMCAITALGSFDPKRGGHLILWDLKLVIEFPPGSTILIPSAILRHSNVNVQPGETRYSFTQYTAGSLFRWVDHGFQSNTSYFQKTSAEEQEKEQARTAERWAMGLGLFSTVDELSSMNATQPPCSQTRAL